VSQFHASSIVILLVGLFASAAPPHSQSSVRIGDDSDWWSTNRNVSTETLLSLRKEIAPSNFEILGVVLDDDVLKHAAKVFGPATTVQRGDAATGREQACYSSLGKGSKVHLVFEQDEIGSSFYLFSGGADWNGSENCVASNRVAPPLHTGSGLHLGETPAQVISVLGRPSQAAKDEFIYSYMGSKETSPQDLAEARKRNPNMSDADFRDEYGHYNLSLEIRARFEHSKLVFLAATKVVSN
jgi:hypothetical protein